LQADSRQTPINPRASIRNNATNHHHHNHVRSLRTRKVQYIPPPTYQKPHQINTPPTRQNNDSLASLQAKVSQLRSVTVDIYDNARDQHVIDNTSESFSNMTTSIKGSARRLGVMASQGNKVAVFKLAGIIVATVVVLWWILSWFW